MNWVGSYPSTGNQRRFFHFLLASHESNAKKFIFTSRMYMILLLVVSFALLHVLAVEKLKTLPPAANSSSARVYKGEPVTVDEFPFFVQVAHRGRFCGGALIAPKWVITSDNCADDSVTFIIFGPGVEKISNASFTDRYWIQVKSTFIIGVTEPLAFGFALIQLVYSLPRSPLSPRLSMPDPDIDLEYIGRRTIIGLGIGESISNNLRPLNDTGQILKKVITSASLVRCSWKGHFWRSLTFELCTRRDADFPGELPIFCETDIGGPWMVRVNTGFYHLIAVTRNHISGDVTCRKGFDHPELRRKPIAFLARISPHIPAILHTIDMQPEIHNQQSIMDRWMILPHLLTSEYSELWSSESPDSELLSILDTFLSGWSWLWIEFISWPDTSSIIVAVKFHGSLFSWFWSKISSSINSCDCMEENDS